MSDQATNWFTETPQGQGGNASQPVVPAPQSQPQPVSTPQTLTAAEARKLFVEILDERERKAQSDHDKKLSALQKEYTRLVEVAQRINGAPPTAEQAAVLRQQAEAAVNTSEVASPPSPGQASAAGEPPGVTPAPPTNWKVDMVNAVLRKENITLDRSDPDAAKLRSAITSDDPDEIRNAVRQVVEARKARAAGAAYAQTPMSGGGSSPGNPIAHLTDPGELIRMGLNRRR